MRQALRKVVIVFGFFLALGIANRAVCPNAEASYGLSNTLETIGIATGIGTAIGLSTIAFYDTPTAHMKNALMGAGAGLIVGLGVAAYLLANSPEGEEITPEELLVPKPIEKKPDGSGKMPDQNPAKSEKMNKKSQLRLRKTSPQFLASVPATFVLHASAHWAVAVRVLELRF